VTKHLVRADKNLDPPCYQNFYKNPRALKKWKEARLSSLKIPVTAEKKNIATIDRGVKRGLGTFKGTNYKRKSKGIKIVLKNPSSVPKV